MSDEPSPYFTLPEAAAFLRLKPRTLDNMRQRGTGPIYGKHGGRVVYHRDDILAWAVSTRRRTTAEKVHPLQEQGAHSLAQATACDCRRGGDCHLPHSGKRFAALDPHRLERNSER